MTINLLPPEEDDFEVYDYEKEEGKEGPGTSEPVIKVNLLLDNGKKVHVTLYEHSNIKDIAEGFARKYKIGDPMKEQLISTLERNLERELKQRH